MEFDSYLICLIPFGLNRLGKMGSLEQRNLEGIRKYEHMQALLDKVQI